MHNVLGGTVDPHAAFLLLRGMKTLGIRVNQQNASALEIASRLESHPCIQRVSSCPDRIAPQPVLHQQKFQSHYEHFSPWNVSKLSCSQCNSEMPNVTANAFTFFEHSDNCMLCESCRSIIPACPVTQTMI